MSCPGHAGVKGNDWADWLVGKAAFTSGLLFWRSEVLRSLRHYLQAQNQGHHTTDHLEKREVERGSTRRFSLKGRERAIVNQTNIGAISKATLRKLLRDRVESIWDFLSAWIPSWTELSWQWLDALTSWWTHSNGFNAWLWLTDLFSFILFNHYYFLKVDSSLQGNLGHSNCVWVIMMQREYLVISSRKPWTFPLFCFNFPFA